MTTKRNEYEEGDLTDPYADPSLEMEGEIYGPAFPDPFARYRSEDDPEGWAQGVRPSHIAETVEDVLWQLAHAGAARPSLACEACGARYQHNAKTSNTAPAVRWFLTHDCEGEGVVTI